MVRGHAQSHHDLRGTARRQRRSQRRGAALPGIPQARSVDHRRAKGRDRLPSAHEIRPLERKTRGRAADLVGGQLAVECWDWGAGKLCRARIVPCKTARLPSSTNSANSAAACCMRPSYRLKSSQWVAAGSSSATTAAPLRPPPKINRKQDFNFGQRVSFPDQSLKHHVGQIVRLNQRTAAVHCEGRAWRVGYDLLRHVAEVA